MAGLLSAVLLLAACGDDGEAPTSTGEPTTAPASTTTPASPSQPETAIWPFAADGTRFDDPTEAATSFAVDYLGFVDPVIEAFQGGDSRSGEVPIRPTADGPVTTVFVRQVGSDDSWWVIGAATEALQLESPEVLDAISSPVTLTGQSTAFEAVVNVEIREDGTLEPLAEDTLMGGSMGEFGPFSGAIEFPEPTAAGGAIVLMTLSPENGQVWEAGVLRVAFSG